MHDEEAHVLTYKQLGAVLATLIVLTGVTVAVSRVDLGTGNVFMAICIAAIKSSLVLLFFMHLKHENPLVKRTFLITVVILATLITFIFFDVSFR